MRPATRETDGLLVDQAEFNRLAAKSQTVKTVGQILDRGRPVDVDVDIVGGHLEGDRAAAIRYQGRVEIAEPDLIPTSPDSPLLPGFEIQIWKCLRVRAVHIEALQTDYIAIDDDYLTLDGQFLVWDPTVLEVAGEPTAEFWVRCSQGIYVLGNSAVDDETLVTTVEIADRMWRLKAPLGRLTDPVQWGTNDIIEDRVADLIDDIAPNVRLDFTGETHSVAEALVHEAKADRADIVVGSATAIGYEAFFAHDGSFKWRPEPELRFAEPAVSYVDGEDGNLSKCTPMVLASIHNGTIAVSTNPHLTTPISARAYNDDPASPIRWGGRMGKNPRWLESPYLTRQSHADRAATAVQSAAADHSQAFQLVTMPNPAVEVSDVAYFRSTRLGIERNVIVNRHTASLRTGPDELEVHSGGAVTEELQ